jgi:P63C domain
MNTKEKNTEIRKVKHRGKLDLAGFKLPCFVLEDGTRVLSSNSVQLALKMVDKDDKKERGPRLRKNLSQKTLQPFINQGEKGGHFDPILCYDGKIKINAYKATVLPDICDIYLEARKHIELDKRQKIVANQCEILVRAFAKVGIIALIDEATGYQKVRDEFELQKMLTAYVSEETLQWQKTFHDSFYGQLYRLWNKTPASKRPWFFGTLTNELVYKKLPKGVLEALKIKTPKSKRLHQSLTPEIGREHLKKQIHSVEALAKVSKDKNEFSELIERYHPSKGLKQKAHEIEFDKALKIAINTPPLKTKDLKKKLEKNREKKS